jgi:hypothetical protein
MKIRLAELRDIDVMMKLGMQMHQESRFRIYPLNPIKLRASMQKLITNPTVACILLAERSSGEAAGMLAGYVIDYFFSDSLVAQDKYFFVRPDCRGSPAALKLLIAFRRWAENRGAAELCINMSVDIEAKRFDRFMAHMNFKSCGSNFVLPLRQTRDQSEAVLSPLYVGDR